MTKEPIKTSLLTRFLVVLLVSALSVLYAIPNLYGEDPSIQIGTKNHHRLPKHVVTYVEKTLEAHKLHPRIVRQSKSRMLLRFENTDQQLAAHDLLLTTLPHQVMASLNLAPKTPAWLSALGAHPMKLGLDLRGGVHFLLHVDVASVLANKLDSDLRQFSKQLKQKKLPYHQLVIRHGDTIRLALTPEQDPMPVVRLANNILPRLKAVINTKSTYPVITLIPNPLRNERMIGEVLSQTITTLNHRVNELGVSEAVIQRQGRYNIGIDLPGIQDTTRAKDLIGKTATLRFHLVDTTHSIAEAMKNGAPPGSHLYRNHNGQPILLKDDAILTGDAITYAQALPRDGRPAVSIQLGGGGESYFQKQTASHIGQPLAVLYIDTQLQSFTEDHHTELKSVRHEKVINIATIQSALGHRFEVSGLSSMSSAQDLALLLRSGALAAPVHIIQELTIGPSMGQANIHKGLLSLEIGALLVFLFMLAYYRFFGLIANIALLLNIFLIVSLLAFIGATLTLPGIAGIVLTVGMAVDANVLVNERIREELRSGMPPLLAIRTGYDRALSTIIDSNVTTLLVALVLFSLGSGTVKGFAMTLILGLVASMFTSIYVTRFFVEWWYTRIRPNPTQLSIGA